MCESLSGFKQLVQTKYDYDFYDLSQPPQKGPTCIVSVIIHDRYNWDKQTG